MESINLNLIPQGANPVVHAKQFDEGRGFRFNLFNGTAPIVLTGAETITCNVKKPDGNLVTVAVTNTSSNYVEVYTTLQMCACYGANLGEIRLEEDGNDIGTLNFTLSVEESPLNNGIESESSIHNLNTMVDEMVAEEVATQYDSANVIFDNEPTDNHGIGYTVTSEGIKTAIDNAFDYDNTASGSLVHITDGADNIPVKSLVSQIVAVESGSGEKSPDNPYTISGFDNGVVTRCGKNYIDESDIVQGGFNTINGGDYVNATRTRTQTHIAIPQGTYQVLNSEHWEYVVYVYDMNNAFIDAESIKTWQAYGTPFTVGANRKVRIGWRKPDNTTMTPDDIHNAVCSSTVNTYTFAFGQTVYGGHFDNKGNLVVTHGFIDLGDFNWLYFSSANKMIYGSFPQAKKPTSTTQKANILCEIFETISRAEAGYAPPYAKTGIGIDTSGNLFIQAPNSTWTDIPSAVAEITGYKLVYELANPITLAITSQDIPTALGENNFYSNTGDVEVNYYTSKSNDILEFINTEIGKKNGTNIPIEENSQDSIKDYIDDEISTIGTSLSGKANKTEDATITVESGYTLISSSCGKTDRLVHLNFNVEKTGGFATGWQAIGTTDFKPNTLAYCPLWNVTNGLANGEVRIDTDGTINFYVVTAGELRLNANIGYVTD